MPTLSDLLDNPEKAKAVPRDLIPKLRGELARLDTILLCRLVARDAELPPCRPEEDRLLTLSEAAARLNLSSDALYRNDYPFVVKIGKRRRFSEKGIERFIRSRAGM